MPPLEPVIGLEVHVHLNTQSKLFCGCRNVSEADRPNQYVCPICMGFPGTLPLLNRAAVESAILTSLALGCQVAEHCTFARKSYFYPDLPKGYQISQYDEPIGTAGSVHVFVGGIDREVRIRRVHLEEDAAKSTHTATSTLVDFNRAGTPLVEIVTEPDLRSPAEAKVLLEDLHRTMRYLGVSNADMEHGDLRVDANISLRQSVTGARKLGVASRTPVASLSPKTEIKNLNSFRAVERALTYEAERQTKLWEAGTPPTGQSTRGWHDERQETLEQRVKEGEADYRYFPEPDIPPLHVASELIEQLRIKLPELPHAKEERFRRQYQLSPEAAHLLVGDRALADFDEAMYSELAAWERARADVERHELPHLRQLATNYLLGDFRALLAEQKAIAGTTKVTPENFAELVLLLHRGEVNRYAGRELLRAMLETGGDPSTISQERRLSQVSDVDTLRRLVLDVLAASPAEVDKVRAGKETVIEFLVGKVMATTKGRANPNEVRALLQEELGLSKRPDGPRA